MIKALLTFILLILPSLTWAQYIPDEEPFRISVLGCIRQYNPAPALDAYVDLKADVSLWIGDNIYADTEDDPSVIESSYAKLASFPAFNQLKDSTTFIVTWDDHDYGDNNEGRHYPIKAQSKQIFRQFWEMEDFIPADQPGIYHSRYSDVDGFVIQYIMLDPRYNRDDEQPDGSGDTLGEEQWAWLEGELKKEADLRFMVSGYQILLNAETGSETWASYPQARQRLFDLIKTTGAEGVVFMAGDQHYGEVNRFRDALDYDAIELQFSGVNQIEGPEKNIYRVSSVASSMNSYAWIDLYPSGTDNNLPYLQFTIKGFETNQTEVSYRINLSELKRNITLEGERRFVDSTKVNFSSRFNHLEVYYTLDGSDPTASSTKGNEVTLSESVSLKYALFDANGNRRSQIYNEALERLIPKEGVAITDNELMEGLMYRYVEGEFQKVPDFDSETIKKQGIARKFDIRGIANRSDHYGIEFSGYYYAEKAGLYTFSTRSDDGSILYIGDDLIVDNDGSHSARTREGIVALQKGYHPFLLEYFEDYSGESLKVMVAYEDQPTEEISFRHLKTKK